MSCAALQMSWAVIGSIARGRHANAELLGARPTNCARPRRAARRARVSVLRIGCSSRRDAQVRQARRRAEGRRQARRCHDGRCRRGVRPFPTRRRSRTRVHAQTSDSLLRRCRPLAQVGAGWEGAEEIRGALLRLARRLHPHQRPVPRPHAQQRERTGQETLCHGGAVPLPLARRRQPRRGQCGGRAGALFRARDAGGLPRFAAGASPPASPARSCAWNSKR